MNISAFVGRWVDFPDAIATNAPSDVHHSHWHVISTNVWVFSGTREIENAYWMPNGRHRANRTTAAAAAEAAKNGK